ncbi:5-formyltetrahydrofolate cyclo-ligase [Coprococcus sp. AF21-14LB]|nr:5-formyltetrahydrofolate cyclo-ligase [Coprococcus sp. AF21-14LB]
MYRITIRNQLTDLWNEVEKLHLAEWKAEKRKKYLYLRDTLSKDERRKKSKQICHTLCMLEEYRQAVNVFCYVSFRSEVETIALIDQILLDQKHLYVPRVFGREMCFFEIHSRADLISGNFGILEPVLRQGIEEALPSEDSLMILPGVAFDTEGRRLGYGGGYYDRYLEHVSGCKRIGLAYERQIADVLPQEVSDIAADMVITEKQVYKKSI